MQINPCPIFLCVSAPLREICLLDKFSRRGAETQRVVKQTRFFLSSFSCVSWLILPPPAFLSGSILSRLRLHLPNPLDNARLQHIQRHRPAGEYAIVERPHVKLLP